MNATANSMRASRRLRRSMSPPEAILWSRLKGSPGGIRFRRQYAVGPYVADFYCPAAKLIIEVDGAIHDHSADRDSRRDAWMAENGLRVIRIFASDVLRDVEAVADGLLRLCAQPLHHPALPDGPPSRACGAGRSE